jgi:DNA-binding MarR family transcriptional regulator
MVVFYINIYFRDEKAVSAITQHSPAAQSVLDMLFLSPNQRVMRSDLTESVGLSAPMITRLMKEAKSSGFITIRRDRRDARQQWLTLTPIGKDNIEASLPRYINYLLHLHEGLSNEDLLQGTIFFRNVRDESAATSLEAKPSKPIISKTIEDYLLGLDWAKNISNDRFPAILRFRSAYRQSARFSTDTLTLLFDMPYTDWRILYLVYLTNMRRIPRSSLLDTFGIDGAALTRQLSSLCERNLLKKLSDRHDDRRAVYEMTVEGVQLIESSKPRRDALVLRMLGSLSQAQFNGTERCLKTMAANLAKSAYVRSAGRA